MSGRRAPAVSGLASRVAGWRLTHRAMSPIGSTSIARIRILGVDESGDTAGHVRVHQLRFGFHRKWIVWGRHALELPGKEQAKHRALCPDRGVS